MIAKNCCEPCDHICSRLEQGDIPAAACDRLLHQIVSLINVPAQFHGEGAQLWDCSQHRRMHRWLNAHGGQAPINEWTGLCAGQAREDCWRLLCLWPDCSDRCLQQPHRNRSRFSGGSGQAKRKRSVRRDGPFGCPTLMLGTSVSNGRDRLAVSPGMPRPPIYTLVESVLAVRIRARVRRRRPRPARSLPPQGPCRATRRRRP